MNIKILNEQEEYKERSKEMCDMIIKTAMENGSVDNVSCIFIGFKHYFNNINKIFNKEKTNPNEYLNEIECNSIMKTIIDEKSNDTDIEKLLNASSLLSNEPSDEYYKSRTVDPKKTAIQNYKAQMK